MTRTEATLHVLRRLQRGPAPVWELTSITRKCERSVRRMVVDLEDCGWPVTWTGGRPSDRVYKLEG